MTAITFTADRRSILGAGAIAAAAAAVSIPAVSLVAHPRAQWDAAMARYLHAEAHLKAAGSEAASEAASEALFDAEDAILVTRTPDLKALHWKARLLRDIAANGTIIGGDDLDHLLSDLRCLLA